MLEVVSEKSHEEEVDDDADISVKIVLKLREVVLEVEGLVVNDS